MRRAPFLRQVVRRPGRLRRLDNGGKSIIIIENEALEPLLAHRAGGRRKHKLAIIAHPLRGAEEAGGRREEA